MRTRLLLPAGLLALAALAPATASAAGAPFTCEASVLRGQLLTASPIEPLVTGRGTGCATGSVGLASLPAPLPLLRASVLAGATQLTGPAERRDLQQAIAAASVADVGIGSLASLGLALPLDQIALPSQLQAVTIDISAITGPINAGTAPLSGLLPLPLPVGQQLPTSITVDIAGAVRELVKLPTTDLLQLKGAQAIAGASCVAGKPATVGTRSVLGLSVLGNAIDVDTVGDRPIVDTQTIDLSQLDLTKVKLPVFEGLAPGLLSTLLGRLNPVVASAIKALPPVQLPIDLLRVQVTPGTQTKTADSLTQSALGIKISALGQGVVDLTVAEAKVGTQGVDCTPPKAATTAVDPPKVVAAQAPLACTTRRLVLTDVVRKGSRVTILGVADRKLVGKFVTIKFEADGLTAGRALVREDGTFKTTAAIPSKKLRASNKARYQAVLGKDKSLNLKLERRMVVTALTAKDGKVTVAGRVTRPLASPAQTITLTRRVNCKKSEVVARFKPKANGTFRMTVAAPKDTAATVYRLGTSVRKTAANRKLFPTFTLPQGVDLTT